MRLWESCWYGSGNALSARGRLRSRRRTSVARKAKSKVHASYPELARTMNITRHGQDSGRGGAQWLGEEMRKLIGGHPVLANAALDAVKKWRFEAGAGREHGNGRLQV